MISRAGIPGFRRAAAFALSLMLVPVVFAQDLSQPDHGEFRVDLRELRDTAFIQLPHRFLRPGSDSVFVEGGRTLVRGRDYTAAFGTGRIVLRPGLQDTLLQGTGQPVSLVITYRFFPFRLAGSYARRTLTIIADSSGADTVRRAPVRGSFALDDVFGKNLRKSGSLTRGFTVGSNRDLSLNSGFRMQLAGTLGSDVEVAASLTDENTPIQPEGTTQTLQEFDNVFVEIRSGAYAATLGDFTLELGGTEFARLSRKLQGARGAAALQGETVRGEAILAGAVTRGKFATNRFQGSEGVQGPYRLTAPSGDPAIIVIAGTERVFHNGERQTRGEVNDYVIDYSTGEIRFTPRRLITAASRIVVDFEYTDRRYVRSLAAAQGTVSLFEDRGRFSFSYLREADDPDAPIDLVLADSARRILADAGSDPDRAVLSGVTRVDSNGLYMRIDSTLAGGNPVTFYRFDPGNPSAVYVLTFSFVGTGRGEYLRRRPGEFVWIGPGGGDYLPVVLLPFARSQQILDLSAAASPLTGLTFGGEYARSEVDVNRFSERDPRIGGHALRFTADYAGRSLRLGGVSLGDLDVSVRERFVDAAFTPADRTDVVEFDRRWGIEGSAPGDEEIREASLVSKPAPGFTLGAAYGKITRGDLFRSVRNEGSLKLSGEGLPAVEYFVEGIRSTDRGEDQRGSWVRQIGAASYAAGRLVPSMRIEAEDRFLRPLATAGLSPGSFRHRVYAPGVVLALAGPLSMTAGLEWRADDRVSGAVMLRESRSFTQAYAGRLTEWKDLASSLELTLRRRTAAQGSAVDGAGDVRTVLVRHQTRYTPLDRGIDADLFYQALTERSSRLIRVFTRVAKGSGTHRYRGDLNSNGVADEEEFEPVRFDGDFVALTLSSDEQVPVIDLKTGLRLRVQPGRMGEGSADGIHGAFSSETYVRLEEKSTDPDPGKIALLHLSRFRKDSTTIAGSVLFTQDLHVLEGRPRFSGRLRFSERTGLTQFGTGPERAYARERSLRLRWQMIPELSGQADLVNRRDRVAGTGLAARDRDVFSDLLTLDLAYRPQDEVEVGLKLDAGRATDRARVPVLTSDLNAQGFRLVYAFPGAGQARAEVIREEVLLGAAVEQLPFELTGGRVPGKTWLWKGSLEYRLTQFLQASAQYDGRSEGGGATVHTARAEVRAFF